MLCLRVIFAIGESVLVDILIVGGEVDIPSVGGHPYQACLAAKLIAEVGMLVEICVVEESLLTTVESRGGEGKLVGGTMIMGYLDVRLQTGGE